MSFGWIEFVIFTMVFNANITRRVDEEFLWGRQKNFNTHDRDDSSVKTFILFPIVQRHSLLLFARFWLKKFFQ